MGYCTTTNSSGLYVHSKTINYQTKYSKLYEGFLNRIIVLFFPVKQSFLLFRQRKNFIYKERRRLTWVKTYLSLKDKTIRLIWQMRSTIDSFDNVLFVVYFLIPIGSLKEYKLNIFIQLLISWYSVSFMQHLLLNYEEPLTLK